MKIFDAQIRSDTRSDDDLQNLAYFGTTDVVTTAHPARPFADARDLAGYFEGLLGDEAARLERCGLQARVALGILSPAQPRRAHPELWSVLVALLAHDRVAAVGEIGAWEDTASQWALFDRQARIAHEIGLPVIVTPPRELRINMTYKMMARLQSIGLQPSRCLMNLLDARLLRTVIEEGFVGGVAVGYRQIEPRDAAAMLVAVVDELPQALERTVLNSSLSRGVDDILGIPKTVVALAAAGMDEAHVSRLVFANAVEFFRTDR